MFQTCLVCTGEIQANNSTDSRENSILLAHILEIPNLQNKEKSSQINYCPGCLSRILSIRDMLEELEKLEKRILDEKYFIENQLKENSRKSNDDRETQKKNSPTNKLRIKVGAELTAKTVQSMLMKIHQRQVGRTVNPQRTVRIMKNVTIPEIPTSENVEIGQNYGGHAQIQRPVSGRESGIFICHEPPINYHESLSLPLTNGLEMQSNCRGDSLEDPLQLSSCQTNWTASDIDVDMDIKCETNSYLLEVSDDLHVDNFVPASEFANGTWTQSASNSVKPEIGERFGVTEFTDVQGTDEGLEINDKKTYICGICGASFERYNQVLIHDRLHMKAGSSTVSKSKSIIIDTAPIEESHRNSSTRSRKGNLKDRPSRKSKKCDECGWILSSLSNWTRHVMQVHRKEYRFKCPFCSFGCQQKSELEVHKFSHSDARSFKCLSCQKTFKKKEMYGCPCETGTLSLINK